MQNLFHYYQTSSDSTELKKMVIMTDLRREISSFFQQLYSHMRFIVLGLRMGSSSRLMMILFYLLISNIFFFPLLSLLRLEPGISHNYHLSQASRAKWIGDDDREVSEKFFSEMRFWLLFLIWEGIKPQVQLIS